MSDSKKPVRRIGRPPALDDARREDLFLILRQGMSVQSAADYAGVCSRTVYRTAERDSAFADAMRKARSTGEVRLVSTIQEAVQKKDWKAAAWLLSHSYRDRYYKRQPGFPPGQVRELVARFGSFITKQVSNPEERRRIADLLQQINDETRSIVEINRQLRKEG